MDMDTCSEDWDEDLDATLDTGFSFAGQRQPPEEDEEGGAVDAIASDGGVMDGGPTELCFLTQLGNVNFLTQLGNVRPRLKQFIGMLERDGYGELDALKYISVRELADMGMNLGDRAVLRSAMEFFVGGPWAPTP